MSLFCTELQKRDLQHLWHPCSQMKDYESFPPLPVAKTEGSFIHLESGQRLIDSGASWWCKSLGHRHPRLMAALQRQCERFDHVILANTTNEVVVDLSEKLAQLSPGLEKVFYASDGSCAVEIALKMSLHARVITGSPKRHLAALRGSYHGETALTLSVSDLGLYKAPYEAWLQPCTFVGPMPYVHGTTDPMWQDASASWPAIEAQLAPIAHDLTALIVEPIVQGAGGMQVYSMDLLRRLRAWCTAHDVHLIADEIMTGYGRTGKMLACEHANIQPDMLCLGKGLTAGTLPLSAMITHNAMYDIFYDDYGLGKDFLHSHTHTGNALACAVALEALQVMEDENTLAHVATIGPMMLDHMQNIAKKTGALHNIRQVGAVVAADLIDTQTPRLGYQIYQQAIQHGALLRPLGNTLYWCPPLNMDVCTLEVLAAVTEQAIKSVP